MEYYKVGTIVNTHGIRGEVKVAAITDFAEQRFQKGNTLFIQFNDEKIPVVIQSTRVHKGMYLLTFEAFNNINEVEKYKQSDLLVSAEQRDTLTEGQYYYDQIIGSQVINMAHDEIGTVKEIMVTGANDVWVVARDNKKDALLPVIDDVIKAVDIENQIITIDEMEGLLD
ncbi:ribosome maturation factor RimM [Leuconostoc fallax]|uniref:Ribosome maturation factor RimM n=1 Tax=Leuconostoc fallax TaxID=1251 RepID=A0A4R5N6B2_9LACO|nr:ribosome maturation factor RimM [Leuconostoc fallax]MBU7456316.1 ribosome maturation factor RimM [Leuconostoc fallax]MCO6184531.1 ribosome maturation factor RimM [Leuconostoc fallax]TDG67188.1 hypothetical protein C5L23_000142 [Leuconostoc fallax]